MDRDWETYLIARLASFVSQSRSSHANGRIERIGKKFSSNVVHISGSSLEDMMYERLLNKQKMQGVLLDMISEGDTDGYKRRNSKVHRVAGPKVAT